jgi:GNAT superfamily N-acetyltransferase
LNTRSSIVVGPIAVMHRDRVAEILRNTENFRDEEIDVALELFDESFAGEDYEWLGGFRRELLGVACYGPSMSTDRTYDLYWIAVDRDAQGSGCGSVLLAEVERRLEALHARMLVIETSSRSDYTATRGFYLKRGYVEAARVREFYAPDDDRIILTKRLAGSPRQGWGAVA